MNKFKNSLFVPVVVLLALRPNPQQAAYAATLRATSAYGNRLPQPGDVLAVAVVPAAGETIRAVGMAGFDTPEVKFSARPDGSARAFLGFPFDRTGGSYTLHARVQLARGVTVATQNIATTFRAASRAYPSQHISMQSSTASTMSDKSGLHREKLYVQASMRNTYPAPLWDNNWTIPARGRATSSYGVRRWVNGKWWGQHNGGDIRAGTGTPVLATNNGRVVLSEHLPTLRGNCIVIDHGCNVFSLYLHLSKRLVRVGDTVRRGQLIGKVGATGFVTGPHLHWEMRVGWEPVDPFKTARFGLRF